MTATAIAGPIAPCVPRAGHHLEIPLMRLFVTGASGFIGSAVVSELIRGGHQGLGLALANASAEAIAAAGAEVHRGTLDDSDSLHAGASAADGVVHLAFIHDFSDYEGAVKTDLRAIETFGAALEGTDRPLGVPSGLPGTPPGGVATERDRPDLASTGPREAAAQAVLGLAERGIRSSIVRLAASGHAQGDHGFVPRLIDIAREKGVSGYVGDGSNLWPAVHRLDAARLFRLAAEKAPAGKVRHGTAREGPPLRPHAEASGRHRDL